MTRRDRAPLIHAMFGIGGLAIGSAGGALLVAGWKAEWVEAAGTWIGSIATVLTVLWAVNTFRADRRDREAAARGARNTRNAERRKLAESVTCRLLGGGGNGNPGTKLMESVRFDVDNNSAQLVIFERIDIDRPVIVRHKPKLPMRLQAGASDSQVILIEPSPAPDDVFAGKGTPDFLSGRARFRIDDQLWEWSSTAGIVAIDE